MRCAGLRRFSSGSMVNPVVEHLFQAKEGGGEGCPVAAKHADLVPTRPLRTRSRRLSSKTGDATSPTIGTPALVRPVEGRAGRGCPDVQCMDAVGVGMTIASSASGFPPALVLAPSTARLLV